MFDKNVKTNNATLKLMEAKVKQSDGIKLLQWTLSSYWEEEDFYSL